MEASVEVGGVGRMNMHIEPGKDVLSCVPTDVRGGLWKRREVRSLGGLFLS